MTKVKTRNSSGITLIALVLTIIVLLILAAISISMLSGENSILNRATQAKANTGLKQIDEKIKLANAAAITRGQGTLDYEVLKDELAKVLGTEGEDWTISAEDTNPWVVIVDGNEYPLSTRGTTGGGSQGGGSEDEVTELSIALTRTHQDVAPTVGENVGSVTSENIPIPTGFYAVSGTTKAGGFVISSVQNDNLANEAGGDQFVWVPVEQNQKLSLVVKSPDDITSIKLIDPSGAEMNLGISGSIGKNYSNTTITPTYNGLYTAEVTIGTEKTTETLLVRSLYAQDAFNDYFTDEWAASEEALNLWDARVGSPGNKTDIYQRLGNLADDEAFIAFAKQNTYVINGYTDTTENYTTSVNTYGGFYVGRFEAGLTARRTSGNPSTSVSDIQTANGLPLSQKNKDSYTNVTRSQASGLADNMYSGKSHLLTGVAWDRTLGWIINTSSKSLRQILIDSTEWGNYSNDTFSNTAGIAKTGEFSQTIANNIYDLAGNVNEWTSETGPYSIAPCVSRGGYYGSTGSSYPACNRGNYDTSYCGDRNGFRVALFL